MSDVRGGEVEPTKSGLTRDFSTASNHFNFLERGTKGSTIQRECVPFVTTQFPTTVIRDPAVIQLLAEGRSNKETASVLNLSVKTIEAHRANIMRKLRLRSASDLVRYAIRNRIVQA